MDDTKIRSRIAEFVGCLLATGQDTCGWSETGLVLEVEHAIDIGREVTGPGRVDDPKASARHCRLSRLPEDSCTYGISAHSMGLPGWAPDRGAMVSPGDAITIGDTHCPSSARPFWRYGPANLAHCSVTAPYGRGSGRASP